MRRHRPPVAPQAPNFWDNIVKEPAKLDPGEHWVWIGPTADWQPIFREGGRILRARRVVWEDRYGPLSRSRKIRVACSLATCVNPDHCLGPVP